MNYVIGSGSFRLGGWVCFLLNLLMSTREVPVLELDAPLRGGSMKMRLGRLLMGRHVRSGDTEESSRPCSRNWVFVQIVSSPGVVASSAFVYSCCQGITRVGHGPAKGMNPSGILRLDALGVWAWCGCLVVVVTSRALAETAEFLSFAIRLHLPSHRFSVGFYSQAFLRGCKLKFWAWEVPLNRNNFKPLALECRLLVLRQEVLREWEFQLDWRWQ